MKKLYFILLLFIITCSYAQQKSNATDIAGLTLYPNPVTTDKLFINTAANAPKKIAIFDVLGTPVIQTTIIGNELNVAQLGKGVYIMRIIEKDKVATRKLIIK